MAIKLTRTGSGGTGKPPPPPKGGANKAGVTPAQFSGVRGATAPRGSTRGLMFRSPVGLGRTGTLRESNPPGARTRTVPENEEQSTTETPGGGVSQTGSILEQVYTRTEKGTRRTPDRWAPNSRYPSPPPQTVAEMMKQYQAGLLDYDSHRSLQVELSKLKARATQMEKRGTPQDKIERSLTTSLQKMLKTIQKATPYFEVVSPGPGDQETFSTDPMQLAIDRYGVAEDLPLDHRAGTGGQVARYISPKESSAENTRLRVGEEVLTDQNGPLSGKDIVKALLRNALPGPLVFRVDEHGKTVSSHQVRVEVQDGTDGVKIHGVLDFLKQYDVVDLFDGEPGSNRITVAPGAASVQAALQHTPEQPYSADMLNDAMEMRIDKETGERMTFDSLGSDLDPRYLSGGTVLLPLAQSRQIRQALNSPRFVLSQLAPYQDIDIQRLPGLMELSGMKELGQRLNPSQPWLDLQPGAAPNSLVRSVMKAFPNPQGMKGDAFYDWMTERGWSVEEAVEKLRLSAQLIRYSRALGKIPVPLAVQKALEWYLGGGVH